MPSDGEAVEGAWDGILVAHARRYPRWQVADVYKLLHQGVMGSEHAFADEPSARAWLEREIEAMGTGPSEPLVDPITPDGAIVRVHLRPYTTLGLEADELLAAFLRTAREVRGSGAEIGRLLERAAAGASPGTLAVSASSLRAVRTEMQATGYAPVHHSPAFTLHYRPAYRVVAREFLPRACLAEADVERRRRVDALP